MAAKGKKDLRSVTIILTPHRKLESQWEKMAVERCICQVCCVEGSSEYCVDN